MEHFLWYLQELITTSGKKKKIMLNIFTVFDRGGGV